MSYARFSYSDVYVFMSVQGHLECCGCMLGDQCDFDSTQAMVDHLAEHRAAGHNVPHGIEQQLWDDDRNNWIDYERCDVDGCDERATCGSPTENESVPGRSLNGKPYVRACSLAHARTLGGFSGEVL